MRVTRLLATSLIIPALTGGCTGDTSMSKEEVESYVQDALAENDDLGALESVTCEGGLVAREDDEVTCRVRGQDSGTDVTVLVDAVNDDGLTLTLEYMTLDGLAN